MWSFQVSERLLVLLIDNAEFQKLDKDPFNLYQTWMKKSDLKNYLLKRKERQMAPQAMVDKLTKAFPNREGVAPRQKKKQRVDLKQPVHGLSLTVSLNNFKQFKAVSTDLGIYLDDIVNGYKLKVGQKRFRGQGSVMGGSATEVL